MRQPASRWLGKWQYGRRPAAAVAIVTVVLAGCQAAAGASAKHSADAGTSVPGAGPGSASASARPAPSFATPGQLAGASARIMIVGDSITEGSSGDYTWQYRLYKHLLADGVRPRMVGPYHWLFNNVKKVEGAHSYADPNFEHANDASWGMTLLKEKDAIRAKVAKYRPDYLLVLLGLDDMFWYGISQPDMAANLASFIAASRAARPRIRIVLGLIPPDIHTQTNPVFAASVASFNKTIRSTAAQLSTATSPIAVAHDGSGISVAADLWDGTHLNANGEIKVAAAFADALARTFHIGSAYPRPFPVLPTGPLVHSRLTITPSAAAGRAKLSWSPVPGAESYYVYVKDLTQGETKFRKLTWPLNPGQDPWTVSLLTPGDTYAFKLQACKGVDCGAFSNVATVTALS